MVMVIKRTGWPTGGATNKRKYYVLVSKKPFKLKENAIVYARHVPRSLVVYHLGLGYFVYKQSVDERGNIL